MLRRVFRRRRRRTMLRDIREHMLFFGRDPGDLTQPRAYRQFLRGVRRLHRDWRAFGASTQTWAAALDRFGSAAVLFVP